MSDCLVVLLFCFRTVLHPIGANACPLICASCSTAIMCLMRVRNACRRNTRQALVAEQSVLEFAVVCVYTGLGGRCYSPNVGGVDVVPHRRAIVE